MYTDLIPISILRYTYEVNIVRNIFDHARLFAVTQFHDAVYRIQNHAFKEALHGSYVEFHGHGHNHFHGISLGIGFFIGAFGNQGIIDIRYGQNLGIGADFLCRHTHRVSASIDLFMVLQNTSPVQSFAAAVRDFFTLLLIARTSDHAVIRGQKREGHEGDDNRAPHEFLGQFVKFAHSYPPLL